MFEKFTEKARRVVFFARYDASQLGARTIEPSHLLLGLLREDRTLFSQFFPSAQVGSIQTKLTSQAKVSDITVAHHVELPLSDLAKRVLSCAEEESDRLQHSHIGTRHILLGLLRVEDKLAWPLLQSSGLRLSIARAALGKRAEEPAVESRGALLPSEETLDWIIDTLRQQVIIQRREQDQGSARPFVPDPGTAVRIAEAVWTPIFGKERVERQRPLQVNLVRDTWIVSGSPPDTGDEPLVAIITRSTGQIRAVGPEPPEEGG